MVTFGGVSFPHVLGIEIMSAHEEIERTVPNRNIAYRVDKAQLGRTVKVSGEIRGTNIDTVAAQIEQIRALNDGTKRALDLQDGTSAFNAQLVDPEYELQAERWFSDHLYSISGKFRVPYMVTFLEVA